MGKILADELLWLTTINFVQIFASTFCLAIQILICQFATLISKSNWRGAWWGRLDHKLLLWGSLHSWTRTIERIMPRILHTKIKFEEKHWSENVGWHNYSKIMTIHIEKNVNSVVIIQYIAVLYTIILCKQWKVRLIYLVVIN